MTDTGPRMMQAGVKGMLASTDVRHGHIGFHAEGGEGEAATANATAAGQAG